VKRKAKRSIGSGTAAASVPNDEVANAAAEIVDEVVDQVTMSNLSLHELFEQQTRDMLDRADIDEEQKQSMLVAMACPCCGAGGISYSVKLKR
jgi:hypothetical protein